MLISIKESSRKYLRFMALNKVWQYRVLCFGLTTAPHLFTRVVEPLAIWARSQGIHIHVYPDDWLILAEEEETLHQHTQKVLSKARELGWIVNLQKSALKPSRKFDFLGMEIDTAQNSVRPVQKRLDLLTQAIQEFLTKTHMSPRQVMILVEDGVNGRIDSVRQVG
jgi:hypothetical protein